MNPLTHLLASWIIAAKTTDNLRDRRLVTLAGVAPDLDGLGHSRGLRQRRIHQRKISITIPIPPHVGRTGCRRRSCVPLLMAALARRRWRVLWLSFLTFHLHLLCDLDGFARPGQRRPLAHLLFRAVEAASGVGLEIINGRWTPGKTGLSRWCSLVGRCGSLSRWAIHSWASSIAASTAFSSVFSKSGMANIGRQLPLSPNLNRLNRLRLRL